MEAPLGGGKGFQLHQVSFGKKRGGSVITSAMRDFSDWIWSNDLVDLPLRAADFTWSNMRRDPIISRLDRFLVSSGWLDIFPDCVLTLKSVG